MLRVSPAMETITLQQLQEMFAGLRSETDWDIDGELLWGYYFTAAAPEVLEAAAETLSKRDFEVTEIFESDDEPVFILQVERLEKHTPETLFARNAELEAFAAGLEGVEYDGMDVNPFTDEDECDCGCDGECEDCDCDDEKEEKAENEGEHQCGCGTKHCHSENEPIENPTLVAAIAKIVNDQSEEAQHELTFELERGLYIVPVFSSRSDTDCPDDEAVQVLVCTDENDAEFLPLFTDEAALKAWTTEAVSGMVLTAPEAWDFILSQPDCAGGVVNPGDAGLPLSREMITLLKKMIDDVEAETTEAAE